MSHDLARLLAAHTAADAREQEDLLAMRDFARTLADPFSRAQWPAHFTGSAVVVSPEGGRVVLVHHAKLLRWLQPGGHAEPADAGQMQNTALREAREETGLEVTLHALAPAPLDVDVHVIPARKAEPEHRHLDVRYLFVARDAEALRHDPAESFGAQWLAWGEALARADEAPLHRLLEKARAAVQR